jgi:3-oxoacyl-[acyl-carrier protein] reductase
MVNRVALVTGASRGIGRATALVFAQAGYDVVAAARAMVGDSAKPGAGGSAAVNASDALDELRAANPTASAVNLDLASAESIKEAIGRVVKEKGRVDILVNNAGITRDGLAVRMKPADWDAVMRTNLDGSFLCIQQVLSGMMRNRWGRIINITSVVGQTGSPGQVNYAASKAGLIGLTKSLAQEVASRNITVNAVAPGYISTDMTKDLPEELKQTIMGKIPLARMGTPGDVAAAVKFLASDEASYITGQVLAVNGGMYM